MPRQLYVLAAAVDRRKLFVLLILYFRISGLRAGSARDCLIACSFVFRALPLVFDWKMESLVTRAR